MDASQRVSRVPNCEYVASVLQSHQHRLVARGVTGRQHEADAPVAEQVDRPRERAVRLGLVSELDELHPRGRRQVMTDVTAGRRKPRSGSHPRAQMNVAFGSSRIPLV